MTLSALPPRLVGGGLDPPWGQMVGWGGVFWCDVPGPPPPWESAELLSSDVIPMPLVPCSTTAHPQNLSKWAALVPFLNTPFDNSNPTWWSSGEI